MGFIAMFVKKIYLVLCGIVFFLFQSSSCCDYVKYAHEVTSTFCKEAKEQLGLRAWSSGGSMPYDIQSLSVSFNYCQNPSIEQARELEIAAVELFLKIINSKKEIRPYLRQYPASSEMAEISIYFVQEDGHNYQVSELGSVMQVRGNIIYDKNTSIHDPTRIVLKETYEEAIKKLQHPRL